MRRLVLALAVTPESDSCDQGGSETNKAWPLKRSSRCAIYVIDTKTGDVAHWLRISGVVKELYDVVALPGIKRPMMIGFRQQEIRRTISIEG